MKLQRRPPLTLTPSTPLHTPYPLCHTRVPHPTLTVLSLLPLTKRLLGSAPGLCAGCQDSEVIHLEWPLQAPSCRPLPGSHSRMEPFMSPLATYLQGE